MKLNLKYLILFGILFGVLGYFRENFFVAYNHLMYVKYYGPQPHTAIDEFTDPFNGLSYNTLYYLKYPFTVASILLFGILSFYAVRLVLGTKKLWPWVVYSYLILLTLAGLSMAFGYLINGRLADDEYTLSRWLVGIIQSPIIAIIIIAAHQLLLTQQEKEI